MSAQPEPSYGDGRRDRFGLGGDESATSSPSPGPAPEPAPDLAPDPAELDGDVDWDRLPDPVRGRIAESAATALGELTATDVPARLRRFVRFAPAKRAKLAAGPLLRELTGSPAFRASVVAWWDEHRTGELEVAADDGLTAAAAAVLRGVPHAAQVVADAARVGETGELRAELDAALSRVEKLTSELERMRGELTEARAQTREAGAERAHEYQQLRRRVSEQGARLRAAAEAQAAAEEAAETSRSVATSQLAKAAEEVERERARAEAERERADRAVAEVQAARQAAREARQADEVRLALLLDTVGGAVDGLRRELGVTGGGPRPGDLVTGASVLRRGAAVESQAALDAVLAVPALHLVVDGYNVSKTGYPELPLADQRSRLVGQLAALAARTGAEITVVFDGAGVVTAPPRGSRGLRVLFSDPGVLADDVIRSLVAAEPEGRPVLVATSDRAVVASVRKRGAYAVPSAVLLTRLGRP